MAGTRKWVKRVEGARIASYSPQPRESCGMPSPARHGSSPRQPEHQDKFPSWSRAPWAVRHAYSPRVFNSLVCPVCKGELEWFDDTTVCLSCRTAYPLTSAGKLDFTVVGTKRGSFAYRLGKCPPQTGTVDFGSLDPVSHPHVDFTASRFRLMSLGRCFRMFHKHYPTKL